MQEISRILTVSSYVILYLQLFNKFIIIIINYY